jgi:carboxymethylenebutenolidase
MKHRRLLLTSLILLTARVAGAQAAPEAVAAARHGEKINVVSKATSEAEVFRPSKGKPGTWPGVVLVSDSTGLDDFLRKRAADLAAKGFQVVALNPRLDVPTSNPQDPPHERALREIGGAVTYLEAWCMDPTQVAMVGFGTGGSLALDYAMTEKSIRALIVNYAPLPAGDPMLSHLDAPLLINQAGSDPTTTDEANNRFLADAHSLHINPHFKQYPKTSHGFDREDSPAYDPAAASDATARTVTFLKANLKTITP